MKNIFNLLILNILCCLFLVGCKKDRIDHEDENYIYVWKYTLKGDSILKEYYQPIYYDVEIINKRRRYIGVLGKGGHYRYYVTYKKENGEKIEIIDRALYWDIDKGDIVRYKENYYPYHNKVVVEIKKK